MFSDRSRLAAPALHVNRIVGFRPASRIVAIA
jgi:hypothetical protein